MSPGSLHEKIKRAVQWDDCDALKRCIAEGADIHKTDDTFMCKTKGYTLIHWAIRSQSPEALNYLIALGVDYKTVLPKVGDLLQFSKEVVDTDVLDILLALDFTDEQKKAFFESALFSAATKGQGYKIHYLLDRGADINVQDRHGESLLHHLAFSGENFDTLKLLVEKGIDLELKDNAGETALDYAIGKRHEKIINYLQERGARGDVSKVRDEIALFKALEAGDIDGVRAYIRNGRDVNIKNNDKNTPLHIALENNYDAIVKLLLEEGADIHTRDNFDNSPILLAAANGDLEFVKEDTASVLNEIVFFKALEAGDIDAVRTYIRNGGNVNIEHKDKDASLHIALVNNHDAIVKLLLEEGADIHPRDYFDHSPILSAAARGKLELVKLLLDRGADIDDYSTDSQEGGTVLMQACIFGHPEVAKFLLENGADIDEVDAYGRTALHIVKYECNDAMANLLLQYGPDLEIEDDWGTKAMDIGK
jgi:ankyrin repeat protein